MKIKIVKRLCVGFVAAAVVLCIAGCGEIPESQPSKEADVIEDADISADLELIEEDLEEEAEESVEASEEIDVDDLAGEVEAGTEFTAQVDEDLPHYYFRNDNLLESHYEKHGIEMGFDSPEEYEEAASAVITNENALHKIEKEDGDEVYYIEDTNEFVVLSKDGYVRTYFNPSSGIKYYNRQ